MTLRSIWHIVGKGFALLKSREAGLGNVVVWFHPRPLFCGLVPNLFERLFLSSGLLIPQSRTSPEHEEVAEYPFLRVLAV